MSSPIAEQLAFKDKERRSLSLSADEDYRIYVDYAGVLPRVRSALQAGGAPKLMVHGGWGTGKTHTLRHTAKVLLPDVSPKLEAAYISVTGLGPRSSFLDIYRLVYLALEQRMLEALRSGPAWQELEDCPELPLVLHEAVALLQAQSRPRGLFPDARDLAPVRAWFIGQGLTFAATRKLGLSARLVDVATPDSLVRLLRAFAWYLREHGTGPGGKAGTMLFLDEGAALSGAGGPSAHGWSSINEGFRALADPENQDIGVMFAVWTLPGRPPFLRNDVMQRLEQHRFELPTMDDPMRVASFVQDLNVQLAERSWFTLPALESYARRVLRLEASPETPGSVTPRDLLRSLQNLAERVAERKLPIPLTPEHVNVLLPLPSV